MSRDSDMNATAMGYGNIVLNRGIVEYAATEEEVCLVVAHEIGHHAANHVARGTRNQMIGAMIGVAVVGLAGALAGSSPGADANSVGSPARRQDRPSVLFQGTGA